MATAVQPSITPKPADARVRLAVASVLGAAFVVAGVAVALYLVPLLWQQAVSPVLAPLGLPLVDAGLRLVAQIAAAGGVVWAGTRLAGTSPPRGLRGGILFTVSAIIAVFFVARAVGMNTEDYAGTGMIATLAVTGVLLAATYYALISPRAEKAMTAVEDQGWVHTFQYKRTQGLRYRRYTMIGILLIGWSGVYTIRPATGIVQSYFGSADWVLRIPFTGTPGTRVTVLNDVEYTVPVLLAVLTLWLAWRAVNIPQFADFLIATEAEMNKVSWSTRKRLIQDTVVVLVTVVLMTLFLFAVDWFWGTVLSWKYVGVLPDATKQVGAPVDAIEGKKVNW